MKKFLIVPLFLYCSLLFGQIDSISNGESGLSVRGKLNRALDTISNDLATKDTLSNFASKDTLANFIEVSDTSDFAFDEDISFLQNQISTIHGDTARYADHFENADETDQVFQASVASAITSQDTASWNAAVAGGDNWGSQVVQSDNTINGEGTSLSNLAVDTTIIATIDSIEAMLDSWSGTSNITTVGTISTGTWSATNLDTNQINNLDEAISDNTDVTSNSAFTADPSSVITAGTDLEWSGNTLNYTGSGFSGDYNDLSNQPTNRLLPGSFNQDSVNSNNDVDTLYQITIYQDALGNYYWGITPSVIDTSSGSGDVTGNESAFDGWDKNASDDFDGDYNSLSNQPNLSVYMLITSFNDSIAERDSIISNLQDSIASHRSTLSYLLSQVSALWDSIAGDTDPPIFVSAEIGTINDSTLTINWNENLHKDSISISSGISVEENGVAYGIDSLWNSNDTTFARMDSIAHSDSNYTVSLTQSYPYLQDSSFNTIVNFTDSSIVNNIISASLDTLSLAHDENLIDNGGGNFVSDGFASYNGFGRVNMFLEANDDGYVEFTATTGGDAILGFDADSAVSSYGNYDYGMWASDVGGANIQEITGGIESGIGQTYTTGSALRLDRTSGTITIQYASDGENFSTVYTFSGTHNEKLYIKVNFRDNGDQMEDVVGYNLSTE